VVGFAAGVTLIFINFHGSEDSSQFVSHDEAKLWMILLALQPAFWAAVTGYAWTMARHYLPRRRQELKRTAASVTVIGVLSIGLSFAGPLTGISFHAPLWGARWKLQALSAAAGLLVSLPSLLGIFGVQASATRHLEASIQDSDIEGFIELRDDLNRFLALLGATIGLAVLAAGALRNAIRAFNPGAPPPAEIVLAYGGFLTLLLAFAYAPANYTLIRLGLRIREVLLPERPPPKDPGFGEWYATRKNLTELLQLEIGTFQRLQTGVLILSPLLSAALSLAIGKAS
jgi:hypothetical protein